MKNNILKNTAINLRGLKSWLQETPFGNNHLSDLPEWFYKTLSDSIDDLENYNEEPEKEGAPSWASLLEAPDTQKRVSRL